MSSSLEDKKMQLRELRVADHEIYSSKREICLQLSPGAVAFPMERPVAQARVRRLISKVTEAIDKEYPESAGANKPKR